VTDIPEDVRRWVDERQAARASKDFGAADDLRERIREAGFEVVDRPGGSEVRPIATPSLAAGQRQRSRPDGIVQLLDQATTFDVSVQWVVEGWPEDVLRGIDSFRRHHPGRSIQQVIVDISDTDPGLWPEEADVIRLEPDVGWAAARNAGLEHAAGAIVLVVDGSIEATGDVFTPLERALTDPAVGVTGPFGIVTADLHEFRDAEGPGCDAVEAYLMAFRREVFEQGLRFDPRFRFYRTADIELSFQILSKGLRATVTGVPVRRHDHRVWQATAPADRDRLSKRNFYRFLDRWRGRFDLTVAGRRAASGRAPDD